jgi:leucyl aminopeptidase
MKISIAKPKSEERACDLMIMGVFKAKKPATKKSSKKDDLDKSLLDIDEKLKYYDKKLDGHLLKNAIDGAFKADEGQIFHSASLGLCAAKSLALVGLGDPHYQSVELFRRMGGFAFRLAHEKRSKKIILSLPEKSSIPLFDVVQALCEGFKLASYRFDRYHTKDKNTTEVKELEIALPSAASEEHSIAIARGLDIAQGVILARDLINDGPMELNPVTLAKAAEEVAKDCGLSVEVFDEKQLKKEKMNLMLAVGSAASAKCPPRMVRLHYKPKKSHGPIIALVGKGVTFDSGGLDIKTADGMLDMKVDMSGSAAVLGVMSIIARLKPNAEVVGYMGCVENGLGPHAYHPGDIIFSRKGTSVEINNTDAEGRLVLADCIDYAQSRDKPDILIDIATLTGACMVALGTKTAGVFANNDQLADSICQSGKAVGESFWRLPLLAELKDVLKSPVADMKNSGERWGGAITGALFIEEFVRPETKWAHLDIAGPATNAKSHPYLSQGGVGFSVRTLVDFIMGQK